MLISCATPQRPKSVQRQLIARHFRQVVNRSDEEHDRLCNVFAITFRPGNRTGCFSEPLRNLGQGVLLSMSYARDERTGQRTMPICGFRAKLQSDGLVSYGGQESPLFRHDAALRFSNRSRREPLNPTRNQALAELALRMDRACLRALGRIRWLPSVPQLPQVMLGFAVNQPPEFEDTEALRELAAVEMNVSIEDLGANGEMLLQSYLRDLWDRQLIHPGDPMNNTGGFLISAEFCTQAHRALRAYEDYSALLGAPSSNPARRVRPLEVANPASAILTEFGIENLEQQITDNTLQSMVSALRRSVGMEVSLTEMEAFDAFANSLDPIRAWSPMLGSLRAELETSVSETVTDEDLLRAAARPDQPLLASHGCVIQVLQRHSAEDAVSLRFPPDELQRRAEIDLTTRFCPR